MRIEEANKLKEDIKSISDNPLFNMVGRDTLLEIVLEKIDMLVESEEEQQPCEDCISRAAVLEKKELVELEDGQSFYCINPKDVETLPSVTPQPKMGEWLTNPLADYAGEGYFICSKCKNDVYDVSDYCPNCGADMRGDSE